MSNFGAGQYRRWSLDQKKRIVEEYEKVRIREAREGVRGGLTKLLYKYNITGAHIRQWGRHLARSS